MLEIKKKQHCTMAEREFFSELAAPSAIICMEVCLKCGQEAKQKESTL